MTHRIPCGRVIAYGENCCDGHLCDACDEILRLRSAAADALSSLRCQRKYIMDDIQAMGHADDAMQKLERWVRHE